MSRQNNRSFEDINTNYPEEISSSQDISQYSTVLARFAKFWHKFLRTELDDIKSPLIWHACAAEFIGTLLLCFYHIGIVILTGDQPPPLLHVSVGHGVYVAAVVTALGATSGCHMNPVVTIAFLTLREVGFARASLYIASQSAGAITGTILLREIYGTSSLGLIAPGTGVSDKQVICTEIIVTAFLLIVVVATSDTSRSDIQGFVPLIVGLTVTVNTLLSNKVSGSCMNPARALGPAVVMGDYTKLWMYCLGPCCGALIGAHLYTKCLTPTAMSCHATLPCSRRKTTSYEGGPEKEAAKVFLELKALPETYI